MARVFDTLATNCLFIYLRQATDCLNNPRNVQYQLLEHTQIQAIAMCDKSTFDAVCLDEIQYDKINGAFGAI